MPDYSTTISDPVQRLKYNQLSRIIQERFLRINKPKTVMARQVVQSRATALAKVLAERE